jgi:hypothetical protein
MSLYKKTTEKLKELKTWAQVKSPKPLQPALSYALDWLAPELLGTGFRMRELSDFSVQAEVPARSSNFDFQGEVHQGLVLNAGLELSRAFMQKQMPESFFRLESSGAQMSKKNKWNSDLELTLKTDQAVLDDFFIDFQRRKKSTIEFNIKIKPAQSAKSDSLILTLHIEKTELIA